MIITSFDPGRDTSYARFDTQKPWDITVGLVDQIGVGRLLRPCPIHIAVLIRQSEHVIVEEVGARPEQGVSAMFTFGLCVGTVLGAISAWRRPLVLVTPQQWKKSSKLGGLGKDEAKTAARRYATELWPQQQTVFRVKGNHGMAEAALMARWYFLEGPGRDVSIEDGSPMRLATPAGAHAAVIAASELTKILIAKMPAKKRIVKAIPGDTVAAATQDQCNGELQTVADAAFVEYCDEDIDEVAA